MRNLNTHKYGEKGYFEVWIEGYRATGECGRAFRLDIDNQYTAWYGETFKDAVLIAIQTLNWDIGSYNKEENSYWGCRFFKTEKKARKSFG